MRYHMRNYLLPKWGKTPVEFITANAVNEWVGAPELAHLSPVTIKGIATTLQLALGKRFGKGAISYPSRDEVENDPRCYLAEEVKQIVEAAKGQYKVLFKLAAETGARAGELYALTVGDLLFTTMSSASTRACTARRSDHRRPRMQSAGSTLSIT
jgi:integrase